MSVSLIATTECSNCVSHTFALNRLRKWNFLTVCACCALGIGGLGLSVYLYRKQKSLSKSLVELKAKLDSLSEQLEGDKSQLCRSRSSQSNRSTSRRSSFRSEPEFWNTPNTSPTRIKSVEFLLDDIKQSVNEATDTQLLDSCQGSKIICEDDLILSDNRSLELLQMQDLNDIIMICEQNQEKYENDPKNSKWCIEYIKSLYVQGEVDSDVNIQKELRLKAYEIAKTELKANPSSYLTHKWYAIVAGRVSDYMTINEKVKLGFEFKEHLDIAIGMNDSDYLLYYLRGRWTFKMCNLNWAERYGVRILFGKIPNVNIELALADFLMHEELHTNKSKGCSLYLAKCYINQGEIEKALKYLYIANELPLRTNQHVLDNEEIESLIKKYSN